MALQKCNAEYDIFGYNTTVLYTSSAKKYVDNK